MEEQVIVPAVNENCFYIEVSSEDFSISAVLNKKVTDREFQKVLARIAYAERVLRANKDASDSLLDECDGEATRS